jgi:hypothetical protein
MSITAEYKRERDQLQMLLGEIGEMLGESSGFVQRQSKIGGNELIQILTLGCLENGAASLSGFCQVAQDLEISLSTSGLHQRLSAEAVELLRQVCQLWLEQRSDTDQGRAVLGRFGAVHIVDSSRIQLPDALAAQFAGSRNGATMKVQLAYEYHSGRIEAIELEAGRKPDQKCTLPQDLSAPGDLVLFDLGYFSQDRFAELDNEGGYFLSRLQGQVGLYEKDDAHCQVDLLHWLKGLPETVTVGERDLRMGRRQKVPVRVVYYRLPQQVAQERRRKAKQAAKKNRQPCSQQHLDWLDWIVFVTNVPVRLLTIEQVSIVYRLRWQIEILFKVWKQEMDWGKMGQWRLERVLCQFYARCLALLLFHRLLEKYQADFDWELSWQKALRTLKRKAQVLIEIVRRHFQGILSFLKRLDSDFRRFACKTKRRKSLSTYALLELVHA